MCVSVSIGTFGVQNWVSDTWSWSCGARTQTQVFCKSSTQMLLSEWRTQFFRGADKHLPCWTIPLAPSFYFHFSYFLISLNHCLLRNILLISRGFSFNSIVAISHVLYVLNLFRLLELVLCAVECPALWLRGVFILVLSDAFYRWSFRPSCLITFPLFIFMCYTIALCWILKITYLMTNIYKYQ